LNTGREYKENRKYREIKRIQGGIKRIQGIPGIRNIKKYRE
jgi:hypothetical protein